MNQGRQFLIKRLNFLSTEALASSSILKSEDEKSSTKSSSSNFEQSRLTNKHDL